MSTKPIKIKKCLYVGLGGTGMTALLHTKKMFVETYGEVPPMIGFLGIDADSGAYRKSVPSKYGEISLAPNEQMKILVEDARSAYNNNQQHFSWVPKENVFALTSMVDGCGQIRTNGRFALTCNFLNLTNKIREVASRISSARIVDNPKYEQNDNAKVEVHVVFSVAGGTGAGTFLNMAYIIKKALYDQCKTVGYAVLPDVFEQMQNYGMERVKSNAYGALWDLDWFMHFDGTESQKFNYVSESQEITGRPYEAVFLIDNKNEKGDTHSNVNNLAEMISLALVISAGELSDASASVADNVTKSIMNGDGMVANKRAWVSGMGACEIIFRGHDMSELNALKNAQRIIQRMMNSCEDPNILANAWIDSPEVNIRENGGSANDNVIDFLLSSSPEISPTGIEDPLNGRSEINGYLQNVGVPQASVLQKKTQELSTRVKGELKNLVKKCINQECGVGLAKDVLEAIQGQVNVFLGEMDSEKEELLKKQSGLDNAVTVAAEDLKEYSTRFLKSKSKLSEFADELCAAGVALAVNQREVMRRSHAIVFFNGLLNAIKEEMLQVNNVESKIKAVNQLLVNRIAELTNHVDSSSNSFFQIDLAQAAVGSIRVNDDEIQICDFLKTLPSEDKFYNIDVLSPEEVYNLIMKYTQALPTAKKWEKTTIDDMMKQIDKETPGELDNVLKRALAKAMPLLSINTRGEVGYNYGRFSYVGVPLGSTLLTENGRLSNIAGGNKIEPSYLGMKDRVIIYNQVGVVPTYFIGSIENYKQKYDNCQIFSHIDNNFVQMMNREKFSIYPVRENDTKDVEYWVQGFAFGLIKNENGKYYVKDKKNGKPLYKHWVALGQYRDQAFEAFKADLPNLREQIKEYFANFKKTNGMEAAQNLIADVKENYLDKYSQVNMTIEEIEDRGNELIAELLNQELECIENYS